MVLFVSYSGTLGGAERLLLDLAAGLEHECAIACPPGPLQLAAQACGLRTFALRERSLQLRTGAAQRLTALADLAGHGREVIGLAQRLEPEALVAWGMRTALVAPAARRYCDALAFQHNDFLPGRAIGRAVQLAARRMALVTTPSAAVMRELTGGPSASGWGPTRTEVIAPGVDVTRFRNGGPAGDRREVLVLGAIAQWKRPDLALEAVSLARARLPDLHLRLAGTPLPGDGEQLRQALEERAARPDLAGAVEFAGQVDDPVAALARASCLLHCADREPFGIAVLEALAAGRPAVVPDSAGPAEIVDSTCGRRYRPGDPRAAAAALVDAVSDLEQARRLGAAGRLRAEERFALHRQRARYREALAPYLRGSAGDRGGSVRRAESIRSLTVVTVTHNSAQDLAALLGSCDRHLPGVRVVVADCASRDDTLTVAHAHPTTTVLELPNLGFGRACNRAVGHVGEPVTALLNPDVELIDDSLLRLAEEVLRPGAPDRLLAPRVLNGDGSVQDTVHPAPLSAAELARSLLPPAALPGRLGTPLAPWRSPHARRVGWAVGCALVGRTATLRQFGPFDERIFLYGEDMELGLRAARHGVATWLWPAGRLIHHGGHSIEAAYGGEAFDLRAKARHDAVALARGHGGARLDDAAQALTFASRLTLKRALGRDAERERRQLAAVRRPRRT